MGCSDFLINDCLLSTDFQWPLTGSQPVAWVLLVALAAYLWHAADGGGAGNTLADRTSRTTHWVREGDWSGIQEGCRA